MTPLIVIGGAVGAGKTTLARRLAETGAFQLGLESQLDRPFQAAFAAKPERYGLANQVDYLLRRAEQERTLRAGPALGLQDGGLDVDFHIFTHFFQEAGYLSPAEYDLCRRLYNQLRLALAPPELVLFLEAPLTVVERRYRQRGRALEIARLDDLARLNELALAWRDTLPANCVLTLDAGPDDFLAPAALADLMKQIETRLGQPAGNKEAFTAGQTEQNNGL